MSSKVLASGTKGPVATATGPVLLWQDSLLDSPETIAGSVVYDKGQTPLFRAAFIIEHGAVAFLMAEGGKNYHPLILAVEAGIPTVAGIGKLDGLDGQIVTVDSHLGQVYAGQAVPFTKIPESPAIQYGAGVPDVYVNVGYPAGLNEAARCGAAGLGLLRTEFAAVKTLALHLNQKSTDGRRWRELLERPGGNEADALYTIAQDSQSKHILKAGFRDVIADAVEQFGSREVIVRTLDIARRLDEPMGNRGIRRCVGSGGDTLRLLCEAIREVLEEKGGRIGLILPLVSHYAQIKATVECLLASGLHLHQAGTHAPNQVTFGWEIEQPAASQNNLLWLTAFTTEFGQPPHMIGIGTNDLTQFTIALGRDADAEETDPKLANYLRDLYDEHDFSVIKQILEAAYQCRQWGTRIFLLGQAGADPILAPLLFAYQVTPSVAAARVGDVQAMAAASIKSAAKEQAIKTYKDLVLAKYPSACQRKVDSTLEEFFTATAPP
jgi:phosphoenolpyruvate-protein kinase (PTS system EI component)